ncbi:hypothetical protein [Halorhodospira neutriphila]|uniref:Uncharacterized protein n=1 Tax=Halorhodospira neutriphila TaxID=168379 RepID=A0ABS1E3M5_9GAMM|nr:hypothetical protein [Halorhodospira neutriphila]MBK1725444.1 hypothetical protein [Halorhodospira neutriphila]
MYEIQSDVPAPAARAMRYPLDQLEVGQSLVLRQYEDRSRALRNLRGAVTRLRRSPPEMRFTTRIDQDGNPRTWRVE